MPQEEGSPFSYGHGDLEAEKRASSPVYVKVPAVGVVRVCLLQELPIRFVVHFIDGHPQLCWGQGRCGHCSDRRGKKVHYVYRCFDLTRRCMGLADFTPYQEAVAELAREQHGFIKGQVFQLKKEGRSENGRLSAECLHSVLDFARFGDPLDAEEILSKQYGLERSLLGRHADVP